MKPLNNNQNQNRTQVATKENKNKLATVAPQPVVKPTTVQKDPSPTLSVNSNEGLKDTNQHVNHQIENNVFVDSNESLNSIKVSFVRFI